MPTKSRSSSLQAIAVDLPPIEQYARFLRQGGKRLTRQKRLIVEQIFSHHDHFDVNELLDHLQQVLSRREISRPTVYRTLAELAEGGILRKMTLGGRTVYEHDYGYPSHDHLFCQRCHNLIEFYSPQLERICNSAAKEHNFQVLGHRLMVHGLCDKCSSDKPSAR